jgi:hypothetical protein
MLLICSQHNNKFTVSLLRHVSTQMSHRQAKLDPVNVFDNYTCFLGSQHACNVFKVVPR